MEVYRLLYLHVYDILQKEGTQVNIILYGKTSSPRQIDIEKFEDFENFEDFLNVRYSNKIATYAELLNPRIIKLFTVTNYPKGKGVGINRLCSATFEQLLAFRATFCSASNLE